jgi:uncharacterized protein (TIGR00730 family)
MASILSTKSICIYCGGYTLAPQKFKSSAEEISRQLVRHGFEIVYGGSRVGLMGVVADTALAEGGHVIGIIPEFLRSVEFEHKGLTETHIVPDLHTRKRMMIERSNAFLILPGGIGTLDEAFEIILWKKLKLHNKPIIMFNQDGYWNDLIAVIDKTIQEGFSKPDGEPWFKVANKASEVLSLLAQPLLAETNMKPERI